MIHTFDEIYEGNGDAEAYGLTRLLCKYKFVACLYMLCDVLHTLAKLQGSLQAKKLNLATVPVMVENTVSHPKELKEDPKMSTWFKDHTRFQKTKADSTPAFITRISRHHQPHLQ